MLSKEEFAARVLGYIDSGMDEQLAWHTAIDDEFYMFCDDVEPVGIDDMEAADV